MGYTIASNKTTFRLANRLEGTCMNRVVDIAQLDCDFEALTVSDLNSLYDGLTDELRACAEIKPLEDKNAKETDLREGALLDLEVNLLHQASNIKIRSNNDILSLIDLWEKVAGSDVGCSTCPSDGIAMNIFRYLNDTWLTKGR